VKLILAQPAVPRFQWELDVLLTNLSQFKDLEITLLFSKHDTTVPIYLQEKYGCRVFVYEDKRIYNRYIPAIRPYLLYCHLLTHPEYEQGQYLYIDSDIIFREMPDFTTFDLDSNKVYGATCDSYINLDYILGCKRGPEIAQNMARICGITVDQMRQAPGIGAQIILNNPTADFWLRAYKNSNAIHRYLETVNTDIQKWTAEMWGQLWAWVEAGITPIHSTELDFSRPTDLIEKWDQFKIMHNAGVVGGDTELFFKGQYTDHMPFDEDLSWVTDKKVSKKYVEAIQSVNIKSDHKG
jgi:hypothetical protein